MYGPNRVKLLNNLGIFTLQDLITHFPRGHEDRSKPKDIIDIVDGEEVLIEAVPIAKMGVSRIRKNMTICKLIVRDETATCQITWFNQTYLKDKFVVGEKYKFFGKAKKKSGIIEFNSPVFDYTENKNTGKIIPFYPSTYSLSQNVIRQIIDNGLKEIEGELEETLPEYLLKEYSLIDLNTAIREIHFPKDFDSYNIARKRLVYEELLTMQLALLNLKSKYSDSKIKGICFNKEIKISDAIQGLPFKLTKAQTRVLEEIENDMEQEATMNRLLQGDVGSGKTIVSIIAAYKAVKSRISGCYYGANSNSGETTFR